jgi:Protein of unknown function (DUF1566)/Repeat of unknown function (DUF5648)
MANKYIYETVSKFAGGVKRFLLVGGLAVLAACSSSSDGADTDLSKEKTAQLDAERVSLKITLAKIYPKGQMTAQQELVSRKLLQQNPAVLKMSGLEATRGILPQAAATATFMPVYRVQNTTLAGSYFFTIWETEKNAALAANPGWNYEGPAFYASQTATNGLSPVWRFRNKINGSYLFTIYEGERASIASTYAGTFDYEGVAWYASQTEASGYTPLYRFRNLTNGTYLFSAYESEKSDIIANYPGIFEYEGVSYYVKLSAASDRPADAVYASELAVTSQLQPNVLQVPVADSANWSVLTSTTDEAGVTWPTSISAPSTAVLTVGQVVILNEKAVKILSLATDNVGKKILTTTKPEAKDVFSVFKLRGAIPLFPFEAKTITSPMSQSVTNSMADVYAQASSSKVEYSRLVSTPGYIQRGEYDPSLGSLSDCMKVRLGMPTDEEGPFTQNGVTEWAPGVTIEATNCNLKGDEAAGTVKVGLSGVLGMYGVINFNDEDALNQDAMSKIAFTMFSRINSSIGAEAGAEFARMWRIWGKKAIIPGAYGLTVATMFDFLAKAEVKGSVAFDSKYDFAIGRSNTGQFFAQKIKEESGIELAASVKVVPQIRMGFGVGAFGFTVVSLNPRLGVEFESSVTQSGCVQNGSWVVGGVDLIAAPDVSYFGDIRKEMTRTLDLGTNRLYTLREPVACPDTKAHITHYIPAPLPPLANEQNVGATYKLQARSSLDYTVDGGDTLSGANSFNAGSYLWEVLSGSTVLASYTNAPRVKFIYSTTGFGGASVSLSVTGGLPIFTVNPGQTVRLTVYSKVGFTTNTQSFVLLGNQNPTAVGLVQEQLGGSYVKLYPTGSLDPDGRIVKVQWKNSSGAVVAESADLQPVTIHRNMLSGQRPAQLQLTVYDNDGASNTAAITETLLPTTSVTTITPTTATLNTATVFTVTGTNLPLTAILAVADATCLSPVSNTATGFSQTCTPLATGVKTITVKTAPAASGGTVIEPTRTVNVTVPAACTPAAEGTTGYGLVFKGCDAFNLATYYDKTECIKDYASGLIWQGQTAPGTGLRDNYFPRTNYDSTTALQKPVSLGSNVYIAPTQSEVDAISNSVGFKNAINASNLCGSVSWRLPTKNELIGIYKASEYPTIDNFWFPNTDANPYWTSTPSSTTNPFVWIVRFFDTSAYAVSAGGIRDGYFGGSPSAPRGYQVRLVRQ